MINISAVAQEKKRIKNFIESRIQSHFDKSFVDFSKRCRIESDVEKWRNDVKEIWEPYRDWETLIKMRDRKSTRLNSSHSAKSRMPSSA